MVGVSSATQFVSDNIWFCTIIHLHFFVFFSTQILTPYIINYLLIIQLFLHNWDGGQHYIYINFTYKEYAYIYNSFA